MGFRAIPVLGSFVLLLGVSGAGIAKAASSSRLREMPATALALWPSTASRPHWLPYPAASAWRSEG